MFHLLNLYKPQGLTSRDAVNRVQRLLPRGAKIGHAGTLDPLAEGVLVCCLGQATRLIEYVQAQEKRYTGTFLFGRRSDTEDVTGLVEEIPGPVPTRAELEAALASFVGRIEQRPPAFSALKVGGERAYDLARAGAAVELAARPIDVYAIQLEAYEFPEFQLSIRCGSGTYVRSLGRDIAQALGTHAVMSALVRTAIGPFTSENAVRIESLSHESLGGHLLAPTLAVPSLPQLNLNSEEAARVGRGQFIAGHTSEPATEIAALYAGQLIAILTPRGAGLLGATKYFEPSRSVS